MQIPPQRNTRPRRLAARELALVLLPLLVGLACNLNAPGGEFPAGRTPAALSPESQAVGGLSPDEPTPALSTLPQPGPPKEGEGSPPEASPAGQERLFRYAPSSDELPESFGKTRRQPYALHTLVRTPDWDFQVRSLLRGQPAWELIQSQQPGAPPPPPGKEYLLAWVWLRSKITAEGSRDIGLFELFLTGSQGVALRDTLWDIPAPELYYRDIYSGMEMEGWLDFVVDQAERSPLLVFDKAGAGERPRLQFFVALGEDLPALPQTGGLPPNGLGAGPDSPAPPGQTAVSESWQVTLLESRRGQPAYELLQQRHTRNEEPPAGMEYVAFRALLRCTAPQEQVFWIGNELFSSRDAAGQTYTLQNVYTDPAAAGEWLQGGLFPGGELEGWGFIQAPSGEANPVLVFAPDGLFAQELIYLSIAP